MYNTLNVLAQKKQNNATTKDGNFFCPYLFLSSIIPDSIKRELEKKFVLCLLPPFEKLAAPVSCHPDMLIFKSGEHIIMHSDYYCKNSGIFAVHKNRVILSHEGICDRYPGDVLFNALLMDDTLISRTESTSRLILERHADRVNVSQGYTACSCVKVSESALITADRGIALSARERGISVLLIRPGYITLEGYSYGFIGGASFSLNDSVYFFGDLDSHPDAHSIRAFISKHKKRTVILGAEHPLSDFGGAVTLL